MEDKIHYRRKIEELSLLFEVSQILDQTIDLKLAIGPVLRETADQMGIERGTISLLNRNTGEIFIEAAYGLSDVERERGRYRLGEGVTGKVVQSGKPAVYPGYFEGPGVPQSNRSSQERWSLGNIVYLCTDQDRCRDDWCAQLRPV